MRRSQLFRKSLPWNIQKSQEPTLINLAALRDTLADRKVTISVSSAKSGRPHKRPQKPVVQDADEHGADRPTLHEGTESDHGVTESPEGDSTVPGKRPGTHEEDGYSTERPGVHPGQKPESDGHPESPAGSEGKPGVETHYDESEPHKKPTPTEAENEVSEDVQPTEEPAIFGEHGHGGRPQKRPVSKPGEAGEGHGPEELPEGSTTRPGVHYDEDGKPKPETDGEVPAGLTEPTLYDEHGRPQKRPGVMVDESQSATGRPEDDTYGKPEHTERPDQHTRPEENEISTSDRVPAAGKPGEQEKKPDADHAGHPESDSVAPGGVSQYLPPKAPEDGSDDQHPGVKPSVATSPDDEDDESLLVTTDESEEEEHPDVHHDKKPEGVTGHEDDMPQVHDGMTHSPKPEDLVTSGVEAGKPAVPVPEPTPGLGYPTQDSTTSGYDAHEVSGVPVTGMPHVTTGHDGKPAVDDSTSDHTPEGVTRVPGMNIVFDEDGKPHLVPVSGTTSSHDEVTSPGYHDVTGKPEDGAPEGVTKTPGIVYDADGKPHVVPDTKPHPMVPGSSDEHKPTEGTHIVFDKDGKPHVVSGSTPGDRQPTEDGKKPEDEAHTPIMVDGMPDSSTLSPFDEVLNNLANVLRPSQSTTAEPTGTTEAHAEVPGEGSCYMDGVVYENNADVPPLSPCHTKCSCINSIIHCLSLKCPTPPEDVSQCTATHDENSCCPTYICGNDVYTTVPVEGEPTTTPASIHDGADLITPIKPVRGSSTHKPETDDKHHGEKPSEHIRPEDSMGSTPSTTDDAQKPQTVHAGPEDAVTGEPSGMHEPTEDGQHPTLGVHLGHPDHRPIESDKPAHVAPPRPSGYFPVSSDDQHPSTSLPSYFGTRKPILSVDQKPGTDDLVHGTDEPEKEHDSTHKPMDEVIQPTGAKPESDDHHKPEDELVVPTTYRPAYQGTRKPVTGGSTPDHKEPETGDDSTQSPTETKKPSEMAEPDEAEESDKPTRPGADTMKPQEPEDVQKRPDGSIVHGTPEEPQQPTSHDQQHGMGTERPQETPEEEHGMQTPHEHTDKPGYMKPEVESEGRPTTTRPATDSEKPAEEQDLHRPGSTMVDQPEGETDEKKPEDHVGGVKHPEQEESSTEKFHPKPEDTSAAGEEPGYQSTSKPEEGVMPEGIQKKPQEGSEAVEDGHPSTEPSESDEQTPHGVHPTSMAGESAPTQDGSRPVTQGTTPHGEETDEHARPQTGADETTMDKESATSGRPQKPGDHPQVGEEQPSHSTPETVSVHGKPEDSPTTYRPEGTTSGMHGITSPKPQTEEAVPIEALLHPTRMPGTYETQRPEMEPVNEFDEDVYHKPDTADEIMATIFPDFIRPITKRPTRPGSQGEKLPTKPEDSHKPEEGMGKPDQELTTQLPIDLSEIFTLRPFSTHKPDQHRPDFGDFQPGTMIFQKPEGTMPHGQVPVTTPHGVFAPDSTTETPGQVPEKVKPEDVDHIQYVPVKGDEVPEVPEGATLGEPVTKPDGQKYWPLIFLKKTTTTPKPFRPVPQQVFNGTHFIQYVPYGTGEEPEVPEGATLGQPQKGPDGEVYWPIIDTKPVTSMPEFGGTTPDPYQAGQVYNGTHFIQFVPYKEGEQPEVPEEATLGEPETAADGQKYWPIISTKPIPEEETTTTTPVSQPEQIFNGTHFIQYVPFNNGEEPEIPEDAVLGQPQKGPDGQIYWPVINSKPITETSTQKPVQPAQIFNGTNFIQYVPFKDGEAPEVPEGATLGQPQRTPDGQIYWPIIYMKPQPVTPPTGQGQVYNGTNFIQYVPYKEGEKPEVPEEATLGEPQKAPDGQMFWPIIYMKPVSKPVTEAPSQAQIFNGTHFIQYVPFTEGFEPELPEGATLGKPEKRPDGQLYWPVIYEKLPSTPKPDQVQRYPGQAFNGTHFIQYVPYRPSQTPQVPEGVVLGQPEKGPDGNLYWVIVSDKPLPNLQPTTPVEPQVFNGTHYIQYVPYKEGEKPIIPEGAVLGKPESGPAGQRYWPIIYMKPLPGVPITHQRPETSAFDPNVAQVFNGTHYIQYLPYTPGQKPVVPEGATLGHPTRGPNNQMYWPIIYLRPAPGMPVGTQHKPIADDELFPTDGQVFNGTHYIQYVPYRPNQKPVVPQDATLGHPTRGPNDQLYWPIIYLRPLPGVPITYQRPSGFDPSKAQVFNGTHYIQYVPYVPGQRPVVPEEATLGHLTKGPNNQMYWPIIYLKPAPGIPIATEQEDLPDPTKGQTFNGTHYIQYVPYVPGQRPQVPEGATLGHPTRGPNAQMYWPIIYLRPVPGVPIVQQTFPAAHDSSKPEQVYNGTHFILYVPYNPTQMPEVPEGATLGHPQKGPGGQLYWVIISDKPIPPQGFNGTHFVQYVTPVTPEQDKPEETEHKPIQVFNGTHYIQYVPYKPGQKPVVPEGATLGQPTKGPEGQMYWPIIYMKPRPAAPGSTFLVPGHDRPIPQNGQVFNGTHFIRYVPYKPTKRPQVPEGAVLIEPQKGPDGQLYWMIVSRKPLPAVEEEPFPPSTGQIFNGTHYIQYVPYNASQMPKVPEGAVLGHPQPGPEGQLYWVIISDKPLPAQPGTQYVQYVTPASPESSPEDQVPGPMFNGTHYIHYVPYKPGQVPKVQDGGVLGELQKGPGGMYWPIIYRRPPQEPVRANATSTADDHPFWSYGQYGSGNATVPEDGLWSQKPQNDSDSNKGGAKLPTSQYGGAKPGHKQPEKPRPPEDVSYETIDEDHLIEYPSGSDYDETQEQPYGPGTCRYAGKVYVSAQQIPRDDPCDFCFCFRSDIICLQQSCPPPIPGCHEEPIQGFCCPRYECHVRMATLLNVTSTTTTTTTTLPPHFLSHVYKGAAGRTGCFVQGKAYRVGQAIPSASGPCMDCICGGDGKMKCEPKVCTPEPMVRQMMVSEKPTTASHR
ncbi:UNVERIFIED_CONTAM: hypothetical protein PYX00_005544 [Menopon gallinae]|uniref:VWFC domain-containing protein n=1 Tax=Menopon gallinae TaxID=328185 RepID=A0AAW2HT44_9NEOP